MAKMRKPEWIRPAAAARILGVARATVTYRAGTGRYRMKHDPETGVTLVSRADVEREAKEQAAAAQPAA